MPLTRRHFAPPSLRLRTFIRANRVFLIGMVLLLLFNLYLVLTRQQGDALIAINQSRSDGLDTLFIYGTRLGEPITYAVVILIALTYRVRTALFVLFTGIAVAGVTGLLKVYFAQARPMRYFQDNFEPVWKDLNLFDEAMQNVGYNSFPSGHSASAFALFSFICFNIRRPKLLVSALCFILAILVGFSRMYLLYHFLRDVTAGAFLGLVIAVIMFFVQWKLYPASAVLNDGIWWTGKENLPPSPGNRNPD